PRSAQLPLDGIEETGADIDAVDPVQLPHAGRAGDVYLCQVIADHVQPGEHQPALDQGGCHLLDDPAVAGAHPHAPAAAAGRQVAAGLALRRNARQRVGYRLAVDHQDALVAGGDLGQVALHHGVAAAEFGDGLDDDVQVRVALLDHEDPGAAHAVQR